MRRLIVFTGSAVTLALIALVLISWSTPSMADQRKDDGNKTQQRQPAPKTPAAQWNPASVNASVLAGTTTQVTVALTTSAPIPATRVLISNRLRSFVTVSPTTLGAMQPGSVATLKLTISSAITAMPTSTSGFLRLREAREATTTDDAFCDGPDDDVRIARRLPINVAITWASASLPGGGSLSIPPTLVTSVDPDTGKLSLTAENTAAPLGIDSGGIGVSIDANPTQLSMADYYSGNPGPDLDASVGTTSVSGRTGVLFEPSKTMACDVVVVIQKSDGSFVHIDDYGCGFQSSGVFDAIVRSIKLTRD